jgi:hypothetical protein
MTAFAGREQRKIERQYWAAKKRAARRARQAAKRQSATSREMAQTEWLSDSTRSGETGSPEQRR